MSISTRPIVNVSLLGVLASLALMPLAAAAQNPESVVERLYRDSLWQVIFADARPEDDLLRQPATVLGQYFTPHLSRLIVKDKACVERTGEICNLGFDPIWASQDVQVAELSIERTGTTVVTATYTCPDTQEKITILYDLVQLSDAWKITDIRYSSGDSLRALLENEIGD